MQNRLLLSSIFLRGINKDISFNEVSFFLIKVTHSWLIAVYMKLALHGPHVDFGQNLFSTNLLQKTKHKNCYHSMNLMILLIWWRTSCCLLYLQLATVLMESALQGQLVIALCEKATVWCCTKALRLACWVIIWTPRITVFTKVFRV